MNEVVLDLAVVPEAQTHLLDELAPLRVSVGAAYHWSASNGSSAKALLASGMSK
jgi:hypothetical protein